MTIVVETNLPTEPYLTLRWDLANNSPPPRVIDSVANLNLGVHVLGRRIETQTVSFDVLEVADSPPIVATAKGTDPFRLDGGFSSQRNVDEPGIVVRTYKFNISTQDIATAGSVRGEIQVIRADDRDHSWFKIPISLTLVDPIRIVPDRLTIPTSSSTVPCSFRVLVISNLID